MLPLAAPMSPRDFDCSRPRVTSRNSKRECAAAGDRVELPSPPAGPLHRAEALYTRKGRVWLAP